MTIYYSPYDTTVTQGYPVKKINDEILSQYIKGGLTRMTTDIFAITGGHITPLSQPFTFTENQKTIGTVIDLRSQVKVDSAYRNNLEDLEVKATSKGEYNFLFNNAKLQSIWINHDPKVISYISPQIMLIYGRWIAEVITKRFGLDMREQVMIETLACLYYISLFAHERDFDRFFVDDALLKITQTLKISTLIAKETLLDIEEPLTDIHSLVELIKSKCDNVKLSQLSSAILISLLSSTWMGSSKSETLAVAIEHPPTFVGLVYASINEVLYRRTGLSQLVMRVLKGDAKNVSQRIKSLLDEEI